MSPGTAARLGLAGVLGLMWVTGARAQVDEYQVKAAFLYNFAKFVEWPAQSFGSPSEPISICVLGQNPFGRILDEVVSGKALVGRQFTVRQVSDARQTGRCQIIFVSTPEPKLFRAILADLKASSALTVGDVSGFAAAGGVINFKVEGDRVRFEINVQAARERSLTISSKLLNLAQIVKR
jgi:hypothetical protein